MDIWTLDVGILRSHIMERIKLIVMIQLYIFCNPVICVDKSISPVLPLDQSLILCCTPQLHTGFQLDLELI